MPWQAFRHALESQGLVRACDRRVVVALSGGLDSVALAHLFARYRDARRPELQLVAAHFHHGLRGADADADAAHAQAVAERLGMTFRLGRGDVAARAREKGGSVEAVARAMRYAFLEETCRKERAPVLALGHHGDDQVETVYMHCLRGSGVLGLAGMPMIVARAEVRRIRPLLTVWRTALSAYARRAGLAFREDRSNADMRLRRNRVRHRELPAAEAFWPEIREDLAHLGRVAQRLWTWVRPRVEAALRTALQSEESDRLVLSVKVMSVHPPAIRSEVLRTAARRILEGGQPLGARHVAALQGLMQAGRSGRRASLPGGLLAVREYDALILSRAPIGLPQGEVLATLRHPHDLPLHGEALIVTGEVVERRAVEPLFADRPDTAYMDGDRVSWPLTVRRPRAGDRFSPLGLDGRTLLSDFLTDRKVPRRHALIVEDRQGIVFVAPGRIDERVRVQEDTHRVLRLHLQRRGVP